MAAGERALALVGSACQVGNARYRSLDAITDNRDDKRLRCDSSLPRYKGAIDTEWYEW